MLSCLPISLYPDIISGKMPLKDWSLLAADCGLDAFDISILFVQDRTETGLSAMRKELVDYFHGKRQYYWYMKGERALLPGQQDWMRQWLRGWGYEWELPFDRYEDGYIYRYNDLVK